jgi:hypothetical protein
MPAVAVIDAMASLTFSCIFAACSCPSSSIRFDASSCMLAALVWTAFFAASACSLALSSCLCRVSIVLCDAWSFMANAVAAWFQRSASPVLPAFVAASAFSNACLVSSLASAASPAASSTSTASCVRWAMTSAAWLRSCWSFFRASVIAISISISGSMTSSLFLPNQALM